MLHIFEGNVKPGSNYFFYTVQALKFYKLFRSPYNATEVTSTAFSKNNPDHLATGFYTLYLLRKQAVIFSRI